MVLDAGRSSFWKTLMVVASYLVHYNTLLQNTADVVTECLSHFNTKCDKYLLQNATALLENATFKTKCVGTTSYH